MSDDTNKKTEEQPDQAPETPQNEANETPTEAAEEPAQEASTETPTDDAPEGGSDAPAGEASGTPTSNEPSDPVAGDADHDDFDWSIDKQHQLQYTPEEEADLHEFYKDSVTNLNENELITGTVVSITPSDVVLDIGYKSDGLVPYNEFRDMEDLEIGSEVEVYVVQLENDKDQLELSRRKAKLMRAWENIRNAHDNDEVIKGTILSKTKGGLIVDIDGLETFLPGSQIDVKPIIDYDAYVGKTMEFKVVKINEAIKNAVVSHKALIESDLEEQRKEIISQLEKGQVLEGSIKNITDFGAFIDLGGVDGLLYITDISWGRINHPSDLLEINQKLNVVVLDFDDNKRRISLGLKQLEPHPWDNLPEDVAIGSAVKGRIVNIEDYGAFLEIKPGIEGLIHVSEVSWSNDPVNAREFFNVGEEREAMIMTIDREDRKMSLSLKRLTPDPWDKITENFPVGSKHDSVVKNITPYGVFVEMEEGIGGMIHISDLSWTKRFGHPSEFTKVGDDLEIVVLDIDQENRKLSLGHKQIEEDPWDTFQSVFPEGSEHEATVLSVEDRGVVVLMPYGLEAFAPNRHAKKEDGEKVAVDEKLTVKVIEFNRNDKRIIVSHTLTHSDESELEPAKRNERGGGGGRRKGSKGGSSSKRTRKAVENLNKNVQSTTLGDLGGDLADLKKKMDEGQDAPEDEESGEDD